MTRRRQAWTVPALIVAAALVVSASARGRVWASPTHESGHPRIVVLTGLVLLGLLALAGGWRFLRKAGGPSFDSLGLVLTVVIASAGTAAIALTFLYLGKYHWAGGGHSLDRRPGHPYGGAQGSGGVGKPRGHEDSPLVYLAAGALVLVLIAAVGIALWRRRSRDEPFPDGDEAASAVTAVVEESLDALRRETDVRKAVIACYARMERAFSGVGLERARSEVPYAYLARVLGSLRVPDEAAEQLTRLFEEAKFSQHVVDETMRNDAINCLLALRASLRPAARLTPYQQQASLA